VSRPIRSRIAVAGATIIVSGLALTSPVFAQGANDPGPYNGDCVESVESENGVQNGNAYAYGRPAAGCVGKADDKNPPGQLPGGSDPNAGYECDSNEGIGKTNPAHTGCVEQPLI
jgi:hypothetical protein